MDVSNGTGDGTDYRTGSCTTKEVRTSWTHLPDKSPQHCPDPQKMPWTISFRLHDGTIISATFPQPMLSVTLVKSRSGYTIKAVGKPAVKPKPTPKPVRSAKPVPPAKATKPARAKNAA